MKQQVPARARPLRRALGILGSVAVATILAGGASASTPFGFSLPSVNLTDTVFASALVSDTLGDENAPRPSVASLVSDTLFGYSGKLRVRFLGEAARSARIPVLGSLFGDSAVSRPGMYVLPDSAIGQPLAFITMLPFNSKSKGRIGSYRIGSWPGERRAISDAYANPQGFIEVTAENQDTRVSEHFRLRDFLTKDQRAVWPKYLVLREPLIDKLELVIEDLNANGVKVTHLQVMSGFRTPQYNANGGNPAGRASLSRHMYGDAADVFVDNNRDGMTDDLNRDGRVDSRDAKVILDAVDRVERAHPTLVGGGGLYRATRAHGPFVHVDVRGTRARWGHS